MFTQTLPGTEVAESLSLQCLSLTLPDTCTRVRAHAHQHNLTCARSAFSRSLSLSLSLSRYPSRTLRLAGGLACARAHTLTFP